MNMMISKVILDDLDVNFN